MSESLRALLNNPFAYKLLIAGSSVFIFIIITFALQAPINKFSLDQGMRYRSNKIFSYIRYVGSVVIIVIAFSTQLTGLTIFWGAAGAGIAFALQEVIASIAGWAAISAGNFYRPGDRVQLGGMRGDVMDIGFIRTTLMEIGEWIDADLPTGRIVLIANSYVFKEPVLNYSSSFPFLWDEIKIPVRHGSNFHLAKEIFSRIASEVTDEQVEMAKHSWNEITRNFMIEQVQIDPQVTMIITDNWLEFTIRYIVDYKQRRKIRDILNTSIMEQIEKVADQISIASTTVAIVEVPHLHVDKNTV